MASKYNIKGHPKAYTFPGRYLGLAQYLQFSSNHYYGQIEKKIIFDIFKTYQNWKIHSSFRAYDLMDLVNHLLFETETEFFQGTRESLGFRQANNSESARLHYLFLDQVQDLPRAQIYLIARMFNDGFYFSGDTAQGIQKGVSFRFSDLVSMFHPSFERFKLPFQMPTKHQLSQNFRTHNRILALANFLIKIIQELFPKSIDSLKAQQASGEGPKPYLMTHLDIQMLKFLILGQQQKTLDCEQAIIVRNEESKKNIPRELRSLGGIILTVQEAKGWEFRDVVCFQFFSTKYESKWRILKYLDIYLHRGAKKFNLKEVAVSDYNCLIGELKILYTIVTRARCSLILVEPHVPEEFAHLLKEQQIIQYNYESGFKRARVEYLEKIEELKVNKSSWEQRGYMFYQRKNYEQALECYQRANMQSVCTKIRAVQLREQADQELHLLEIAHGVRFQPFQDSINSGKEQAELSEKVARRLFPLYLQAAQFFREVGIHESAGRCYFISQHYQEAYHCFRQCSELWLQLAWCEQNLGMHQDAAINFRKAGEFSRMIYNLGHVTDSLKRCVILEQAGQFDMKEYFYRKFYSQYCRQRYQKIGSSDLPSIQIQLGGRTRTTIFQEYLGVIRWQQRIQNIKKELSHIAKIKSQNQQHGLPLTRFYQQCSQNLIFRTEAQISETNCRLEQVSCELEQQMWKYPSLFYYPTDQSTYKELAAELQRLKYINQRRTLREQLAAAKMADDTLSEQLDLDLWISLHNSRQLFREIYSSFSHLVSPLFPEFITDIKKFQTSLDLKSLRFPSEKIFKEGQKAMRELSEVYWDEFDKIRGIISREDLFRRKEQFNLELKLLHLYKMSFALIKECFEDHINFLKENLFQQRLSGQVLERNSLPRGLDPSKQRVFQQITRKCQKDQIIVSCYEKDQQKKRIQLSDDSGSAYSHPFWIQATTSRRVRNSTKGQDSLELLQKIEQVSPLTACFYCDRLALPERWLSNLLAHFAMISKTYTQNCSFKGPASKASLPSIVDLTIIQPQYLNFSVQRTRFRKENAAFELFQGLVFQGFILEVASIIEDEISLELREHFMDSRLVSELKMIKTNQPREQLSFVENPSSNEIVKARFYCLSFVQQFLLLDSLHPQSKFKSRLAVIDQLTPDQNRAEGIKEDLQKRFQAGDRTFFQQAHISEMLLDIFFEPSFQIQDYVRCELEIGELSELELFQLLVAVLRDRHYPCQGIKTSQKEGTGKISFQKVSQMMQNPFVSRSHFRILTCYLKFFGVTLIDEDPLLDFLQHFVLVRKDSPLLGTSLILKGCQSSRLFCFYLDERRNHILMRFTDIMSALQEFEGQRTISQWNCSSLTLLCLCSGSHQDIVEDQVATEVVSQIQTNRAELLAFYLGNQFVSHQSFGFVFHQLKCYTDLLYILRESQLSPIAVERVREETRQLFNHFRSWRIYAEKLQFNRECDRQ